MEILYDFDLDNVSRNFPVELNFLIFLLALSPTKKNPSVQARLLIFGQVSSSLVNVFTFFTINNWDT